MISYESFTKRFGTVTAADSVSLQIGRGEIVALLGPNGSGKTTMLKAAAGLLAPTSGQVRIGELPAQSASARRSISYLPQKVAFPETLSGREVVEFYRRLRDTKIERVEEVLRFAQLNGASTRAVSTYSGGMVQRLGLAVAALPASSVLLLDEPTAALDPDGLCAFYGLAVQRRAEEKTVVFTSHHLGDVERLADRFAILVNGKLVAVMTAAEFNQRIGDRGVMVVDLDRPASGVLAQVQTIAPKTIAIGTQLRVTINPQRRMEVVDALQRSGAAVLSLTTEEGRLESLYRELVS